MSKKEKLYFTSIDDTFCVRLEDLNKDDLEELNFELIEAILDNNNPEYIWCTHFGEVRERYECKKSECYAYKSKSGRGKCLHRGNLYQYGEKVDVKEYVCTDCGETSIKVNNKEITIVDTLYGTVQMKSLNNINIAL